MSNDETKGIVKDIFKAFFKVFVVLFISIISFFSGVLLISTIISIINGPVKTVVNGDYGYFAFISSIISIISSTIIIILYLIYGRRHNVGVQTVEFYPPEEYDAAQFGYIYGQTDGRRLTVALIVQLASKGYIKIEQSDKKNTMLVTNLVHRNLANAINSDDIKLRTIVVSKIRDVDDQLTSEEKTFLNYLFRNGNKKEVISDFDNFYKRTENLVGKYINIDSDTVSEATVLNDTVDEVKSSNKSISQLSINEKFVYDKLFEDSDTKELDYSLRDVFISINFRMVNQMKDKIINNSSRVVRGLSRIFLIFWAPFQLAACTSIRDMDPQYNYLYFIAVIMLLTASILITVMNVRTEYGESIYKKILGFRDYIKQAENPQLEAQIERNPNYFYNIIPYVYVMKLSKKWIKRFEYTEAFNFNNDEYIGRDMFFINAWNKITK